MKISLFFLLSTIFISPLLNAQMCNVMVENIKGTYTGECKNGKAEGEGKSVGHDTYEGNFKNGYPDGYGIYTAQNGDVYSGNFKKGYRDGKGTMHYSITNGTDSILIGFWKKDKYVGEYEKPYEIHTTSSKIAKVSLLETSKGGNTVYISSHQLTDGSSSRNINTMNPVLNTITSVTVIRGLYITKNNQVLGNSNSTQLQQVQFPFRAVFYYGNGETFELTIFEKGNWDISVELL